MSTNKEVSMIMGLFSAHWPNYPVTEQTIAVYQHGLKDIPFDVLEKAAWHVITTGDDFFPTVNDVRTAACDLQVNTIEIPTAQEAWGEAIEHCRKGNYTNYSHPLIEKAVHIIGIHYWRNMVYGDEMATRAQFIKTYDTLLKREQLDMKMLPEVKEFSKNYQLENGIKKLVSKLEVKK